MNPVIDIAKARALCEAATSGEWTAMPTPEPSRDDHGWRAVAAVGHRFTVAIPSERVLELRGMKRHEANAAFIAAARTLLPQSLDEIEALRALLVDVVKYAREDRAVTPGFTRLDRALARIDAALEAKS